MSTPAVSRPPAPASSAGPLTRLGRALSGGASPAGWGLLAVGFVLTMYVNVVTRTQWSPDSRYYLAWTYRYLGLSDLEAARRTEAFVLGLDGVLRCGRECVPVDGSVPLFEGGGLAVVGPRVVTPAMSAPFVALVGPEGMLVPPVVCYALALVLLVVLAGRLWGRPVALLAGLLLLAPVSVSRWGVMAMTEAPAVLFTVACLLPLPLARRARHRDVLSYVLLLELALFTRQFGVATAGGVALAWLLVAVRDRSLRNPWLPFAVSGAAAAVLTSALQARMAPQEFSLSERYLVMVGEQTTSGGLAAVPRVLGAIYTGDYGYLTGDVLLLAVLAVCALGLLLRVRSELSAVALGMYLCVLAINVVQAFPSNWRYFAPVYPVLLLAGLALVVDLLGPRPQRPWRSHERAGEHRAAVGAGHGEPLAAHVGPAQECAAPDPGDQPRPGDQAYPGDRLDPGDQAYRGDQAHPGAEARPGQEAHAGQGGPAPGRQRGGLLRALAGVQPARGWALLGLLYAVALAVTVDARARWGADSRVDLAWTYRLLGHTEADAARRTYDALSGEPWFAAGCGGERCWQPGTSWLFEGQAAAAVGARPLGQLVAAPFVAVLGPGGMLVPPALLLAVATVLLVVLATRLAGRSLGLFAGAALLLSVSVSRWAAHAYDETLPLALVTACLLPLPLGRTARRRDVGVFAALLALGLLAAEQALGVVVGVVLAWLVVAARERRAGARWLPFAAAGAAVAVAVTAVQALAGPAFTPPGRSDDGLLAVAGNTLRITAGDLAPDRMALAVLLLATLSVLRRPASPVSALALGVLGTTVALPVLHAAAHGTRDVLAAYPLLVLAAVCLLARVLAVPGPLAPRPGRSHPASVARPGHPDREPAAEPGGTGRTPPPTGRVPVGTGS